MSTVWSGPGGIRSLDRIHTIAIGTFLESVRDRMLAVPLLLAGGVIATTLFTRTLSLGQQAKILQDVGLASLCLFSNLLMILAVTHSLGKGVGKGAVLPILARPVRRPEFILGTYAGVFLLVLINVAVILVALRAGMFVISADVSAGIVWAAVLSVVEVMVVGAIAVFFSTVSSPLPAMVFAGFMMLIGHSTGDLREMFGMLGGPIARGIGEFLYFALPNLEMFNVRAAAVHGYPIEPGYMIPVFLYGVLYATAVLLVSSWIFQRRDLA